MNRLSEEIHPLLSKEIVDALHSKQIYTVLDFIKADTQLVVKVTRLNFREVLDVRNHLLKKFSAAPINGYNWYKATLNNTAIIPTGIKGLDVLLNGGLLTGNIYEICGLPASGKTHFCLTVIKNLLQSTEQKIYILDTKNDISGTRIKHTLSGLHENLQVKYSSRIFISRSYTRYDLLNALYQLKTDLEDNLKLRLVVIDSLPAVILNSNDSTFNNSSLNHIANIMRYISNEHHVAFLITNLITTWSDSEVKTVENIACGKFWHGVPNTRLKIEKNTDSWKVTILNSDISDIVNACVNVQL